ncbi:MAG: helix-turn-helix domain-containing protein [Gammaproteobacteria bacterium]|jgi:DNA-binding XRE family transcriptional regulator|nr:helix-turn-helix transcriptional regulator [Zhongshania sp.]MBU0537606.1 helix-turn-helix domain-containing protein [Gammaproteobacteria bacterium]MBU1832064.1 helix-turn-helix domain-containing protein [Gammaproteobacteria bacterium]
MKRPNNPTEKKLELQRQLADGELSLGQAARKMRKIVGMTQEDYAKNVLHIAPRALMEVERDKGNPTLETLKKIARPFGLEVGFIIPASRKPAKGGGGDV